TRLVWRTSPTWRGSPVRRTSAVPAVALGAALLLTACGGGSEDDPASDSTAVPAPAPAPEDDGSSDGETHDGETDEDAGEGTAEGVAPPDSSLEEADGADAGGPLEVTIAAAGDILAHSRLNLTANAYAGG